MPCVNGTYRFLNIDRVSVAAAGTTDALERLVSDELGIRGSSRPIVVTSRSLRLRAGVVNRVAQALGDAPIFDDTEPHVPRQSVLACREAIRAAEADVVVTLGGGTPIDTVKMALLALAAPIDDEHGFDQWAVTTQADGSRFAPNVPTYAEQGYPELTATTWFALSGPASLPPEIVQRLNMEANRAIQSPDVRQRLERDGIELGALSPEAFTQFVKAEIERWTPVVRASGAKAN